MAKRSDFRTVGENEAGEELEELEGKIKAHRRRIFWGVFCLVLILAAIVVGLELWMALRVYSTYEVRDIVDRQDSGATRYEAFAAGRVEYTNDGIVCRSAADELVWNQSFEMSDPAIDICGDYLAVYDRGGTQIYIMTTSGLCDMVETSMPISKVKIAGQGTVAVIMKEDGVSYVRLYDRKGNSLANGEFFQENGAFPVDIALSSDAQKLAVDMIDISGGDVCSVISFYNFGSVGQNEIDNNVGTYSYDGTLIPEVDYVGADRMVAFSDSGLIIFEGTQKPEPKRTIDYGVQIQSVFHNNKYVGITYSNPDSDGSWKIRVYDMNGTVVMENDTTVAYTDIGFLTNNEVCVRDSYSAELFTVHGIRKFSYTFDDEVCSILSGTDRQNYTFIFDSEIDEVRLK